MSLFIRIKNIFKSEANSLVSKFEHPIKQTQLAIETLKKDEENAKLSLSEVKVTYRTMLRDLEKDETKLKDFVSKGKKLQANPPKNEDGSLNEELNAHMSRELAGRIKNTRERIARSNSQIENTAKRIKEVEVLISKFRADISLKQSDLNSMKARYEAAKAELSINKSLSNISQSNAEAIIDKAKSQVEVLEDQAIVAAEMSANDRLFDDIDDHIGCPTEDLADLLREEK